MKKDLGSSLRSERHLGDTCDMLIVHTNALVRRNKGTGR